MTAQIGDIYRYEEKEYNCLKLSDDRLFSPWEHGFHPSPIDTGCWAGYWCEFEITDVVKLQTLHIHDKDGRYPPLNGVSVSRTGDIAELLPFEKYEHYKNIDLTIDYTGKILLADGFLFQYYVHMGLQKPYAFQTLLSFEFENGMLKEIRDQSRIAEQLRKIEEADRWLMEFGQNEMPIRALPEEVRKEIWWA